MRQSSGSSCAALMSLAVLALSTPALAVTDEIRDFLIQDVCVDGADRPIPGDPYSCWPRRNLRQGEKVPSLHVDNENGALYQSILSFPVRSPNPSDPNERVVVAKEFGGDAWYSAFRDNDWCTNGVCNPLKLDGYDVLEMNGTYVSGVGTSDPGINNQSFWRRGCPSGTRSPAWNEDSWIFFPSDLTRGVQGGITHYLKITTNDTCPSSGFNAAYAGWHYLPEPLTYTTGKRMDTITSHHFAGTSSRDATSFEKFYFTREYGFTRWEAWSRSDQCSGSCTPKIVGCNGDSSLVIDGRTFIRRDCRDTTTHLDTPFPLETSLFGASAQLSATQNLVQSATFANQNLGNWNRLSPRTPTNWGFRTGAHTANNVSLAFACAGSCDANSVYQDVSVASLNGMGFQTLRYGALLKSSSPARLLMVAHLFDTSGAHVDSRSWDFGLQTGFAPQDVSFGWDFSARPLSTIRVEFYPQAGDVEYQLDEVYLVRQ